MFEIYKIKEDDTISTIANDFQVSPEYLFKINNFNCDRELEKDEEIIVPKIYNNYLDYYTVKEGINLVEFAEKNNINSKLLSILNGLNLNDYLYPEQVILIPKNNINFYITNKYDTLDNIAKTMKTTLYNIINQNSNIYLDEEQLIIYKEK